MMHSLTHKAVQFTKLLISILDAVPQQANQQFKSFHNAVNKKEDNQQSKNRRSAGTQDKFNISLQIQWIMVYKVLKKTYMEMVSTCKDTCQTSALIHN